VLGSDTFFAIEAGAWPVRIARVHIARVEHAWGVAPGRTGDESMDVTTVVSRIPRPEFDGRQILDDKRLHVTADQLTSHSLSDRLCRSLFLRWQRAVDFTLKPNVSASSNRELPDSNS
jgi:hypothetical protein